MKILNRVCLEQNNITLVVTERLLYIFWYLAKSSAIEAYNSGDFTNAASKFSSLLYSNPDNPDISYNLGAILQTMGT